jgi:pyridoxamine 5'-phosphate oxidase
VTSLAELRKNYSLGSLDVADIDRNPFRQFDAWFRQAVDAQLPEPNTMTLATVDSRGRPSARIVLIKGVDERGFVFFTNYASRKGIAIEAHPSVVLLFPWHSLSRQVIVNGVAERLPRAESEAYFATRPRGAQLSATASAQSRVVENRATLEARVAELAAEYEGAEVACPPGWGGFLVVPETVEFWQGRHDRLHDRLRYVAVDSGWRVERLSP